MSIIRRFGSWVYYRKYVIGIIFAVLLLTATLVGYKQQYDTHVRQNDQLSQIVEDQIALREERAVDACMNANETKKIVADAFRNVVNAIASVSPEDPALTQQYIHAVEEQLAQLTPQECSTVS